ncbi:MAG: ABC transporter ATP-binding protein [Planctomycetes bacterium]|nr:ABC transporter ATP-binding protein [Planctomycetota bacterium]
MIRIVGVHKSFGEKHVLQGLGLEIEKGETLVIIGRSGCGKSVLLKHIVGLIKPDQGQVFLGGVDMAQLDRNELTKQRMRCGVLFQGAALFDSLTVAENISFYLDEHTELPKEEVEGKVRQKMRMVRLTDELLDKKPAQLSGGQKKRVGLARALAMEPEIMLYDEPTTGLDPITADAINKLIRETQHVLGTTGIAVTHDMASAYTIADRIAMLDDGRIIAIGTPEEMRNSRDKRVTNFINGIAEDISEN